MKMIMFDEAMRQRIIKAWNGMPRRWRHGYVERLPSGDVAIKVRGNIRDIIESREIAEYLANKG